MGSKGIIQRLFYAINIIVAIALLFSYLTNFVSPETTVFFSFFGLAYPILLIINLLFIIYWAFLRSKQIVISLIIFILGLSQFSHFFQFPFNGKEALNGNTIKVMSYNVRLFDLYDWTKKEGVRDKILSLVKDENPDVVCFQEFYMRGGVSGLKKNLNMDYVHHYFTETAIKKGRKTGIGTAIYSKYKILDKGEILFENEKSNHCIYVDILKDTDTVRVYNAHLGSIRFDYDDYTFLAGEKTTATPEEDIIPLKKVLTRLKIGFKKRVKQVNQLLKHVDESPYATVLGVDLNDTPVSYSYQQFSSNLVDSFNEKGNWVGSTYVGTIPLLRIDYLWFNKKLKNTSFRTIAKEYSDHRPILGEYSILD